jgi:hypothetical protein
MSPENSKKVAYASQYTDDAKYEQMLEFENGGRFQQARSAHILCRENIETAQGMIREAAGLRNKPYILHRLGIALHIYADTWSHRDVSPMHPESNEAELNKPESDKIDACEKIYIEIDRFLAQDGHPEYRTENVVEWGDVKNSFIVLFKKNGNLTRRCRNWKKGINRSAFGFPCRPGEKDLFYDDGEWFNDAVDVDINHDGKRSYKRRANFDVSDWKYFHDAAQSHRLFVLNELFMGMGLVGS